MKFIVETEPQEILKTSLFSVDRKQLLRSYAEPEEFSCYDIVPGELGLWGEFWIGAIGLEGELSLFVPPAKRDIDVIGYSVKQGEGDVWRFLSCTTIPKGNFNIALSFSFSHETFFDCSQDVVCCLEHHQLKDESHQICTDTSREVTSLRNAWDAGWKIFQREFRAHYVEDVKPR